MRPVVSVMVPLISRSDALEATSLASVPSDMRYRGGRRQKEAEQSFVVVDSCIQV